MDGMGGRIIRANGVGADLRALRRARGLTITDLAARIERSVGWLSQVERDLAEPSIADLRKLATALDQPMSFFFASESGGAEAGLVVRDGARRTLGTAEEGLEEQLLSPDLTGSFEIVRSVFAPGAQRREMVTRPTEEAGYLISGTLDLWVGARHVTLGPGDSFRFAREPFRWRNPGTDPAVVIWVIAPPVY